MFRIVDAGAFQRLFRQRDEIRACDVDGSDRRFGVQAEIVGAVGRFTQNAFAFDLHPFAMGVVRHVRGINRLRPACVPYAEIRLRRLQAACADVGAEPISFSRNEKRIRLPQNLPLVDIDAHGVASIRPFAWQEDHRIVRRCALIDAPAWNASGHEFIIAFEIHILQNIDFLKRRQRGRRQQANRQESFHGVLSFYILYSKKIATENLA